MHNSSWSHYTVSHPKNDCDVTERALAYTLQDVRNLYASIPGLFFERVRTQTSYACDDISVFLCNMNWRHGSSQGETKCKFQMLRQLPSVKTRYTHFFISQMSVMSEEQFLWKRNFKFISYGFRSVKWVTEDRFKGRRWRKGFCGKSVFFTRSGDLINWQLV